MAKTSEEKKGNKEKKVSKEKAKGHLAKASGRSLHISTKHAIEICDSIRYKTTKQAKKLLEDVANLRKALPFKKFKRDMGHKKGEIAAGRYPQKAAKEFLKLLRSVEANAQVIGLDTANLKIQKVLANKAATPMTGGRQRRGTKRTHVEIEVVEGKAPKKEAKKKTKPVNNKTSVLEPSKEGKETPKVEAKTVKELVKREEVKAESVKEEVKDEVKEEPAVKEEVKVEKKEAVPKTEEKVKEKVEETVEKKEPETKKEVKETQEEKLTEEKVKEPEQPVKEEKSEPSVEENVKKDEQKSNEPQEEEKVEQKND